MKEIKDKRQIKNKWREITGEAKMRSKRMRVEENMQGRKWKK